MVMMISVSREVLTTLRPGPLTFLCLPMCGVRMWDFTFSFANDKNVTVLEGAIGFEVVASPVDGFLGPVSPVGALVIHRISRDKAKIG